MAVSEHGSSLIFGEEASVSSSNLVDIHVPNRDVLATRAWADTEAHSNPVESEEEETDSEKDSPLALDPIQPVPIALETALRMTLASFVAWCLTFASGLGGKVVAPSQQWLIGLLAPLIVMRIPTMTFVVGGMLSVLYFLLIFGLASATMLLSIAATGSDAAFVVVFGIWAFWFSGLRYGPVSNLIGIFPSVLVATVGLIALGLQRIVKDGMFIIIEAELLEQNLKDLLSHFHPIFQEMISRVIEFVLPFIKAGDSIDFVVPFGQFEGQTVHVQFKENNDLWIVIDGGIWLLKGMWTWSGLNNPLAVFQNFLITCSWAFLCVFVSPLLPPLRTMRYYHSRLALPMALRDASAALDESGGKQVKERLLVEAIALHGGMGALLTAFEPRILDTRFRSPRIAFLPLFELTQTVEKIILKSLALAVAEPFNVPPVGNVYEECSNALSEQRHLVESDLGLRELSSSECIDAIDVFQFRKSAEELKEQVEAYQDALDPQSKEVRDTSENLKSTLALFVPWVLPGVVLYARIFVEFPRNAFNFVTRNETFDFDKIGHHVKFAIGFAALVSLTVYSDSYHDVEINMEAERDIGIKIVDGMPPASFSSWHLVAYTFATMPTTEGTVKKCMLRIVGTVLGAFSAWAVLRVTPDNSYGFVAWLTITTLLALIMSVDRHDVYSARIGTSPDFGYGGFYFVLTQNVICMEFVAGLGDGDDLVVNRIVSNVTGIAMAATMAFLPPNVMGSSPKWTRKLVKKCKKTAMEFLELLQRHKEFRQKCPILLKDYASEEKKLRDDARYLINDAKRFQLARVLSVDPRLDSELNEASVTASFLAVLMQHAVDLEEEPDKSILERMDSLYVRYSNNRSYHGPTRKRHQRQLLGIDEWQTLVEGMEILHERMDFHESVLDSIWQAR